ncbi:hypothetical protein LCGC14_2121630, partial [marine sediment metagenome]
EPHSTVLPLHYSHDGGGDWNQTGHSDRAVSL